MSARKRIYTALAANGFGQAVTIGTQLVLTPLFFRFWGAERYGEWLILSAIPAYLMFADLGVSSAAGNEMAMRAGACDFDGAQQTFRGAQRLAWLAAGLVLLLGATAAYFAYSAKWPQLHHSSRHEASWVIIMLSAQVGLGFGGSTIQAGFRCAGLNALGTTWANLGRLCEAMGSAGVLLSGQGPVNLCVAVLAIRTSFLLMQWGLLRLRCTWLFTPRVAPDPHLLRRLLWPSLAFMAFPLGYTFALQGPILLIGHLFGSGAAALFVAMRTLARLPVQITNALNNAISPEISQAHGEGRFEKIRQLHRASWAATAGVGLLACVCLAAMGPIFSRLWLGPGRHDQFLLLGLLAVSWASSIWNVSSIVLTATNRHVLLSITFLVVNAGGLGVAWAMSWVAGMQGLIIGFFLAEIALVVFVMPAALAASEDSFSDFSAAIRAMPLQSKR